MHLTKWMTFQHRFVQLSQNTVPSILKNLRFHELAISHESYLLQVTECMSKNDLSNKRLFFSHIKVSRGGWLLVLAGQSCQDSGLESLDVLGLAFRILRCLPQTRSSHCGFQRQEIKGFKKLSFFLVMSFPLIKERRSFPRTLQPTSCYIFWVRTGSHTTI